MAQSDHLLQLRLMLHMRIALVMLVCRKCSKSVLSVLIRQQHHLLMMTVLNSYSNCLRHI
jgi:hypothetical protein